MDRHTFSEATLRPQETGTPWQVPDVASQREAEEVSKSEASTIATGTPRQALDVESQTGAEEVAKSEASTIAIKPGDKFKLNLEKLGAEKLGCGLARIGEAVIINKFNAEGAIIRYNFENPTRKLELDDIILSVNGSSSELEEIKNVVSKSNGTMTMEVERPKIWIAALDFPEGASAGIEFGDSKKTGLPIIGLTNTGAAAKFNTSNPGQEIAAGDFIIKTDAVYMDGQKMLEYIQEKTTAGACVINCTVWRNLPG